MKIFGNKTASSLILMGSLLFVGKGIATGLNKYSSPLYWPGSNKTICNTSPIVNIADPIEFDMLLSACDLDCFACRDGRCPANQQKRCEMIQARRELDEARDAAVRKIREGKGLFVFKETPQQPIGARVALDPDMDVIVIEVPKGMEFHLDEEGAKFVLRITDDDQIDAPDGLIEELSVGEDDEEVMERPAVGEEEDS